MRLRVLWSVSLWCGLAAALAGCVCCRRAAVVRESEPDRYVVVVHGLTADEAFEEVQLLVGLRPEYTGWFTIDLAVPRSKAVEAYRRILKSPYRDRGLLVEWDQEPFLSRR